MDCSKCRFKGRLCDGHNDQKGLPYPWNMWFLEDADLFKDEPWEMFPKVNLVTEIPTKSIPVVDGRISFCPEAEWVGIRTAQIFDTKRRKGGWKVNKDLRKDLQIPDHCKLYFLGTGKDDQLYHMSKCDKWAERLKEYGIDYASPLDWSMYHNSTSCQIVWSLLNSWKSAREMSDAGIKILPNIDGPERVQLIQANWLKLIGATVVMSNFQMIYNRYAFEREIKTLKTYSERFNFVHVILNGPAHPARLRRLQEIRDFTFMCGIVYTNAMYRRMWTRQGVWEACCKENDVEHPMDLFRANFVEWDKFIQEGRGATVCTD